MKQEKRSTYLVTKTTKVLIGKDTYKKKPIYMCPKWTSSSHSLKMGELGFISRWENSRISANKSMISINPTSVVLLIKLFTGTVGKLQKSDTKIHMQQQRAKNSRDNFVHKTWGHWPYPILRLTVKSCRS